jgi:hypothetical protein
MAQDGDEPTKEEVWVWATKVQQKQDETQVLKLLQAGVKSNSCKKEMMNCQIRRVLAIKKKKGQEELLHQLLLKSKCGENCYLGLPC